MTLTPPLARRPSPLLRARVLGDYNHQRFPSPESQREPRRGAGGEGNSVQGIKNQNNETFVPFVSFAVKKVIILKICANLWHKIVIRG